jgi:hypothetical protein
MEEEQEYNSQTYELNQDGRDFILTTGLVNDNLRVTCRDHLELTGPYFMGEYSLSELSSIHKYFLLSESIESAQSEINKAIERQKCGVVDQGNTLKIIIYLMVGTDRSNLTLILERQEGIFKQLKPLEEAPQYMGKLNLENKGNYPKDEQRIVGLEQISAKYKAEQEQLHEQLEQLIDQSMKLLNEAYLLKEDNAKLKERIKLLGNDNSSRKMDIIKLRNEDRALKSENERLTLDNAKLEQLLKNKREINIKDLEENNRKTQLLQKMDSSRGPIARTTKFEKSQIQTFVPRPTLRPPGQTYTEKENNFGDNIPFKTFTVKHT